MGHFSNWFSNNHRPRLTAIDFFRYIGPGMLVTVGFIDPGNWASNIAAGSAYGYRLLWMVTLSTFMLIVLQHNAAHLGIVTGKCLSEAATDYLPARLKNVILISAMAAAVSTAMAELLGGAIALQMLFGLPIKLGTVLILALVLWLQFTNSYRKIEKNHYRFCLRYRVCFYL
jgi:manganese transport protein